MAMELLTGPDAMEDRLKRKEKKAKKWTLLSFFSKRSMKAQSTQNLITIPDKPIAPPKSKKEIDFAFMEKYFLNYSFDLPNQPKPRIPSRKAKPTSPQKSMSSIHAAPLPNSDGALLRTSLLNHSITKIFQIIVFISEKRYDEGG